MIQPVTKILALSILGAFIAFVSGCATLSSPRNEEDVLIDRVVQMMDAKVAGKWDLVYDFYDPAIRPKAPGEGSPPAGRNIFEDYVIESLEILESGEEARVEISNDISVQGFDFKGAPEVQHWVKVKRKWYYSGKKGASPVKTE